MYVFPVAASKSSHMWPVNLPLRCVGKSTLLAGLGREFHQPVFDLDRPDARAAAAADPGFLVSGPEPVLIDEFQHAPEVLDAIKAELNRDTRPGRFVLTGSTRYTVLPQAAQSLTGRAHVINMLPLSQGELQGHRERFIELLWQDPERLLETPIARPCSRDEYVNRILESSTANRYATLLEAVFMIQRLPAWGETLGKRLAAHPKVHVIDSGLAGWLLGLSAAKINSRNPSVLTEFGHLVETFAVGGSSSRSAGQMR